MPKDSYGREKPYHVVTLSRTSSEYQKVATTFIASSDGAITNSNIKEIIRIQNPQLYKSFVARKEAINATRTHGSNEKQLFHGTSETGVGQINHHGLNRSLAGKNGNTQTFFSRCSCSSRVIQPLQKVKALRVGLENCLAFYSKGLCHERKTSVAVSCLR